MFGRFKPKIIKMTLTQFKKKYTKNEWRMVLFNKFLEDIEVVKDQCSQMTVLIFGSYISKKKEPGDIDIMISLIPKKEKIYDVTTEGVEHKYPEEVDFHYQRSIYFLKSAEQLLEYFNENPFNVKNNITISRVIELVDIC